MSHEQPFPRGQESDLSLEERKYAAAWQEPFRNFDFQQAYDLGVGERDTNPGPPYILVCIDEGEDADDDSRTRGSGVIHSAASGILYPEAAQIIRDNGLIAVVYSHDACGGAQAFADRHGINEPGDQVGDEQAKRLAEESGVQFGGRLAITKRPKDLHPAKTIYYSADPKFEPSRIPTLPRGFETSRWFWGRDLASSDVDLAIQIAMGPHGLEGNVTPENPLHIVGVARPQEIELIGAEISDIRVASAHASRIRTSLITTK